MAYTTGTASDYLNMLQRLRSFLKGQKEIGHITRSGTNMAAKGYIRGLQIGSGAVNQIWTIACTTGGGNGTAVFSVNGSVSGAQASLIAGTPYFITSPRPSIYTAGTQFSMWGIEASAIPFVSGDTFQFTVTSNTMETAPYDQRWEELRWKPGIPVADDIYPGLIQTIDTGAGAVQCNELSLRGPGLAENDNIYVNFFTQANAVSNYYCIWAQSAVGFDANIAGSNAQYLTSPYTTAAGWHLEMRYWMVANGRRIIVVWEIAGRYFAAYYGLILPYATPTEYPYPMYVGGQHTTNISYSTESHNYRNFYDPYAGYLYQIDALWKLIQNRYDSSGSETTASVSIVWPYGDNVAAAVVASPGGVYPMLPMIIHSSDSGGNTFGELEGCLWIPGFENQSENTLVIDGDSYIVFHNIYRTLNLDFFALKMT